MPETKTLALFSVAALALLLIPGPVVFYVITRSISQGRQAGVVSALAAGIGNYVHVLAATAGLSAILLSSAVAFSIVKYAGAAYLIYLGLHTLLARPKAETIAAVTPASNRQIFLQGVVVSILNPKTALFFLAFLPQFVDPTIGSPATQVLILGTILVLMGVCTDNLYALISGSARGLLRNNRTFLRGQRYVAGSVYIALGLSAAFSGNGQNR